ncbi:hypothetical protein [Thermococcus sp.]
MKRLAALMLMAVVVLASGCIGGNTGLTEKKVLNAIQNIETARYSQNFSMSMHFIDPDTNKTVNLTMMGHEKGIFNKTSHLEIGNMTIKAHTMGMNMTMNWPYFRNGSKVYFKVDGKWYYVSPQDNLYTQANGSLNINYIKTLLNEKNVTIKKLSDGYAFRVNVTFWEYVNATNQSSYLSKVWGKNSSDVMNITTKSGWVEVHLRNDGTPTFIETFMDIVITVKGYDGKTTNIYLTVHNRVAFSDINEHFTIKAPKGIEKAGNFEDVVW